MQNINEEIEGWSGYDPSRSPGALYPNEVTLLSWNNTRKLPVFTLLNRKTDISGNELQISR